MARAKALPEAEQPAKPSGPRAPDALEIIRRNDALRGKMSNFLNLWQQIADYVQPRKSEIMEKKTPGTEDFNADLYNTTAVDANQVLASGHMDYLMSGRWFEYGPRPELQGDDDAKTWFQHCTEVVMEELALSNFYFEAHEMCLDRGGFGTAAFFTEEGEETLLNFCHEDIGTYAVDENARKLVDTRFKEWKMSARQAVQKFGLDNLGKLCREAYEKENGKNRDKEFSFIHAIYPRAEDERDPAKMDGKNKPIASVYVCKEDKHVCRNSGYDEMPVAVTRFLRWGSSPYGYCPAVTALPTIRQVNFIEQQMDALAEIKAFPRILSPDNMVDDLDLRAAGITTFDPNQPNAKPEIWGDKGEYDIGLERIKTKDEAIRKAFHNDLFELLKQIEREMTAYEVAQRLQEKVAMFSPTFRRMDGEFFQPVLKRVFALCYRAGKFRDAPASVFVPTMDGQSYALAMPQVALTSKLALAIKANEDNAMMQTINMLAPVAELHPEILDNYDWDKVARGTGRNKGVPTDYQRPVADVEQIREGRARQAQQERQLALAQGAASAAKDASQASAEMKQAIPV